MTGVRTCPPIVGPALTKRLRQFTRPEPVVAPLLAHEARKCARRIGFRLFGTTPDIPLTRAEKASFEDGDYVDSVAAEVFAQQKDARIQLPFHWLPGVPLKGKADAGYRDGEGRKIIGETKSTNEKGYSRAIGAWRDVPASPKAEWLIQAGMAACSPIIDAAAVHVVLVDSERFEVAEWLIGVDDPLELPDVPMELDEEFGEPIPTSIRRLVTAEIERQTNILTCCEGGTLPPRDVPGHGIVQDPPAKDEVGDPWQCKYCLFQPSCSKLPAGPVHDYGEMVA